MMATTIGGTSVPKCKYWDKCYRKEQSHRTQFSHPADVAADKTADNDLDSGKSSSVAQKKCVKLCGKTVLFLGGFADHSIEDMCSQAEGCGCVTTETIAEDVDFVVLGNNPGPQLAEAKGLALRIITLDYWNDLVSRSVTPVATKPAETSTKTTASSKTRLKRQRTHTLSVSGDEAASRQSVSDMDTSDENDAVLTDQIPVTSDKLSQTNSTKPVEAASQSTKRSASDTVDDLEVQPKAKKAKKIAKCKYWEKCYRKDASHKNMYLHPTDDPNELAEEEPLPTLADGQTATVMAGTRTYNINRTGDTYTCNCVGWKTQNKSVDKRTCRHLKEYLGEEVECKRVGVDVPSPNKGGGATIFRAARHKQVAVLLAHKYTDSVDPTGWWISEKLDGVRAFWDGKSFYSRLGNEFIPPNWFIQNYPPDMTLDGELFGGRSRFQDTVSIVKNAGSARWKELEYHIFDSPSTKSGFEGRIKAVKDYFEKNKSKTAVVVEHTKCSGKVQIEAELRRVEGLGGEGLMIRQPGSMYEKKRSHTLLKIKTFYDAEAVVIGHERGKGRNASVTGALRCRMENGTEFSVGSGLSDKDRKNPPKVGTIITYKFQEYTNSGCPRFPTYLGTRIDMDAPKDAVLPSGKTQKNNDDD